MQHIIVLERILEVEIFLGNHMKNRKTLTHFNLFVNSGSVMEYLTRDREVAGLSLAGGTVLCP